MRKYNTPEEKCEAIERNARTYRSRHREELKIKYAKWYAEKGREWFRQYVERQRAEDQEMWTERRRLYNAQYYKSHREELLAARAKRYAQAKHRAEMSGAQ